MAGRVLAGALAVAIAYGAAMGLSGAIGALWLRHGIAPELGRALALMTLGASLAGLVTAGWTKRLFRRRTEPAIVAACLASLLIFTVAFDALLLFIDYAGHSSGRWPPIFSTHWFFTMAATFAGVSFYFVSLGLPLLLPFGLPITIVAAFVIARR